MLFLAFIYIVTLCKFFPVKTISSYRDMHKFNLSVYASSGTNTTIEKYIVGKVSRDKKTTIAFAHGLLGRM